MATGIQDAPAEKPTTGAETIYYDGQCGLCHRVVRFVLAEDRRGTFRFGPLQGVTFAQVLPAAARRALPDSFVVHSADGRMLLRSAAAAHILLRLGGVWRLLGHLLLCVPRPLRDAVYNAVGRSRHKWFARPERLCPLVPPDLRGRFLD